MAYGSEKTTNPAGPKRRRRVSESSSSSSFSDSSPSPSPRRRRSASPLRSRGTVRGGREQLSRGHGSSNKRSRSRSPYSRSSSLRRRRRSSSPRRRRSPPSRRRGSSSPRRRRGLSSRQRRRSPSPRQDRSSPRRRQRSRSPRRRKSSSPRRSRSSTPRRQRSRTPRRREVRSPARKRNRTPLRRSKSPPRQRGRSSPQERSRSPYGGSAARQRRSSSSSEENVESLRHGWRKRQSSSSSRSPSRLRGRENSSKRDSRSHSRSPRRRPKGYRGRLSSRGERSPVRRFSSSPHRPRGGEGSPNGRPLSPERRGRAKSPHSVVREVYGGDRPKKSTSNRDSSRFNLSQQGEHDLSMTIDSADAQNISRSSDRNSDQTDQTSSMNQTVVTYPQQMFWNTAGTSASDSQLSFAPEDMRRHSFDERGMTSKSHSNNAAQSTTTAGVREHHRDNEVESGRRFLPQARDSERLQRNARGVADDDRDHRYTDRRSSRHSRSLDEPLRRHGRFADSPPRRRFSHRVEEERRYRRSADEPEGVRRASFLSPRPQDVPSSGRFFLHDDRGDDYDRSSWSRNRFRQGSPVVWAHDKFSDTLIEEEEKEEKEHKTEM